MTDARKTEQAQVKLAESASTLKDSAVQQTEPFCFLAGVWRELDAGAPPPRPDIRRLPAWLLIGTNGLLILVALAALVGIWVVRV